MSFLIVGNAPYAVCLETGRDISPGELVPDFKVTDRTRRMARDGLISIIEISDAKEKDDTSAKRREPKNDTEECR